MSAPHGTVWLQSLALLLVGSGLLVGLAAFAARWIHSAVGQRTFWRAVLLSLALFLICEITGAAAWLSSFPRWQASGVASAPRAQASGVALAPRARLHGAPAHGAPAHGALTQPRSPIIASDAPSPPGVWWPGIAWLIGTSPIAFRAVFGRGLLFAFRRRSCRDADSNLHERLHLLALRLGYRRRVTVAHAPGLCGPAAFGFLRPTIAVPADFTQRFDGPHQDVMLAHELAHLAARDPAWLLFADLLTAALWWQPLVWWMRRKLRAASEVAADEACLIVADGPDLLAACLVELGKRLAFERSGGVGMAGGGFRSGLGRRVERLLHMGNRTWRPPNRLRSRLSLCVAVVLLLSCAVCATAQARSWAFEEGDDSMPSLQRSWRHSLAGAFLLAMLAPAHEAIPAQEPPKSGASESKKLKEVRDEWDHTAQLLRKYTEQLQALQREGEDKSIKKKIADLEAKIRDLQAKRKALLGKRSRVFRLKHVAPAEMEQALENLLDVPNDATKGRPGMLGSMGSGGMNPGMKPGGGAAMGGMMGGSGGIGSFVGLGGPTHAWRVAIDERTQSIVMRGSSSDLQRAADIIALLDQPDGKAASKGKNLRAFKLKFADINNIAQIIEQLEIGARVFQLDQSRRLIVAGAESAIEEIADLIEQLDVKTNGSK